MNIYSRVEALERQMGQLAARRPQAKARSVLTRIQRMVASDTGISLEALKNGTRQPHVAGARHLAMYLCRSLVADASMAEIGKAFGGKHHTTVLHAICKMSEMRRKDAELDREIDVMLDRMRGEIEEGGSRQ